jgi:hypothetical protein
VVAQVARDVTPNISRSTFTADLRGVEIPVDQLPNDVQRVLEANRIDRATLERIAGSDRVLRGDEIGQLYDEIRARNRGTPRSGNIDSVTQVYNALRSHAGPQVDAISGASPIRPGLRAEVRGGAPRPVDDPAEQPQEPQGPSNHDRTLQIAALPPATEGNHRAVRTYLDALSAREQGQRKPRGIDENTWALTRALGIEGITTADVEQYLATGTLPEGKLELLEQRATRLGSWTATNSLTFLINARRSAMAAERLAMTTHMNTLAADDSMRLEIQGAINASLSLDRDLGRGLQGIYRARTIAAEQQAQGAIQNASVLETQALRAREAGDTRKADRLTQQAQAARNRAARIGQSEGDYRSGMHFQGAGNVYRIAAQAQIETGSLRVAHMRDTYGPIQDQPPPELTNDDGTNTSNKVRGAGLLLNQAGTVDGDGGRNHASLGLETARQGALAQFHQIHVERSGYQQRVGANGAPPPARTQFANDQRQAYLDARAAQSSAIMTRIGLYGPVQNLNSGDALTVARLQSENATINQEFNAVLGTSLMTDRQVTQQQGVVTQLETGATNARKGETDTRTRAGEQTSASNDQRDSATPWTRIAQTSGAERRDNQAIFDADTAQRVMNAQVPVAEAGRTLVEDRLANGRDTLRGMQTQAGRDSADAELVRTAMRRNLGPGGATTSISNAYQVTLTNGDNSARASGVALDRANAARPANAPVSQTFIADLASTRLDLARYWTGTTETRSLALGDAARTDAPARLDIANGHIAKANEGRLLLTPGSPARVEIAAGVVREQSSLATARSEYRPGESRNLLRDAEAIADTDLANDPRRLGEARGQIANAGISSVVRSDGRFLPLVRSGNWDETAPDDMRNQSRRLFGRNDLPDNETVRNGRALLRRFDENLAQFPVALRRAGRQFQNGYDLAASQAGVMSRAEGQASSVKMSSLITGAVWVVSLGHVDMKDSVQGWAEDGAQQLRNQNQGYTNEQRRGANDLATGFERAEAAGHGLQYLNAYRMLGLSNMGEIRLPQATFERNRDFMKSYFAPRRAETREWAAFQSVAFPSNPNLGEGSPVARAMTGPVLSFSDSVEALGDERLAIITQNQQFMLNVGKQRMDDARENMWWYVGINAVGEIGLALVTMGATAPSAASAAWPMLRTRDASVSKLQPPRAPSVPSRASRKASRRSARPILSSMQAQLRSPSAARSQARTI